MSQYKWANNKFEYLTGWDRPVHYFFLVIDNLDPGKQKDMPVFSNLDIPSGPGMSIEEIKTTCRQYETELPDEYESSMKKDKEIQG